MTMRVKLALILFLFEMSVGGLAKFVELKEIKRDRLDGRRVTLMTHGDTTNSKNNSFIQNSHDHNLNISEPSVSNLESEIKVKGHVWKESDGKVHGKEGPLVEQLEEKIKIGGKHPSIASIHHKVDEPSVDHLESEIKIDKRQERDVEKKSNNHHIEPSLDQFEKTDLLRKNPKFGQKEVHHDYSVTRILEPNVNELEKKIQVLVGDKNVKSDSNKDHKEPAKEMLPGYEGFHGVLIHGDEAYNNHGGNESSGRAAADLADYKTWLETEERSSKLARFKRLHEEFSKLTQHKHGLKGTQDEPISVIPLKDGTHINLNSLDGLNADYLIRLEEKLLSTIRKLEEEEKLAAARRKSDL